MTTSEQITEIEEQMKADVLRITAKYEAEQEELLRELAYRCKNETDAIKDEGHKKIVEIVKDFSKD